MVILRQAALAVVACAMLPALLLVSGVAWLVRARGER